MQSISGNIRVKDGKSPVIGLFRSLCLEAQDKQWKLNLVAIQGAGRRPVRASVL